MSELQKGIYDAFIGVNFLNYVLIVVKEGHIDICRISRRVEIRVPQIAREVKVNDEHTAAFEGVNAGKLYKAERLSRSHSVA